MALIKRVVGWLCRRGVVFLALIAAMLIYQMTKPTFESLRRLRTSAQQLAEGEHTLIRATATALSQSDADAASFYRLGQAEIDSRINAAQRDRIPLLQACGSDLGALVTRGAAGVIENRKACVRATLLTRQIDLLAAVRNTIDIRRPGEQLPQALRRHAADLHRAASVHRFLKAKLDALEHDYVPDPFQRSQIDTLRARLNAVEAYGTDASRSANRLLAAELASAHTRQIAASLLDDSRRSYHALVDERAKALSNNVLQKARAWAEANDLLTIVKRAALALLVIIATPYLIRLFCYFLLAPLAMLRPAIRLDVPGGSTNSIFVADRSAASVAIRLQVGEELVVRQDHIQTSSHAGAKRTQWFLNWRHPITSLATGLTFLTCIRGDGEVTTVSAVRDGFAEVALLVVPEGSACVLHPRALVAWAQPRSRPLRVETKWRLRSVNAWLTMQLRYVVFHGPARLVVKGGRGVRVERAEHGRVFGQDQLLGFSADLAYSVARTETFWPYFLGREQLLKDRVETGDGVLIIEEAPLAGRPGGEVRHGIEGLIDAGLKVFGL